MDHRHKYKLLNYSPLARKHRKKIYITQSLDIAKVQFMKEKLITSTFFLIKNSSAMTLSREYNDKPHAGEIFANHITVKAFIPKTYKKSKSQQ